VNKFLISGAMAAVVSAPALAQQPTMSEILRELQSLSERVGKLEQDNNQLRSENAELRATNDRLEATSEYLKDNAQATRKQLAEEAPKVAEAARVTKDGEWVSRLSWKTDIRYRHENVEPEEAAEDQTRHRIRARLGLTAKINDTVSATVGLATGGGSNDPRSTNQTLGDGWDRKDVAIDLAYVDWKPTSEFSMQLGKMPQPWFKVNSILFDNDITPEGIATKYTSGPFFASAFGYFLSERSTANEATLLGGQLGLTGNLGPAKLTGAIGYFDVGSVEGEITTTAGLCTANSAFFGGPQGNTTVVDGLGCARLANDFNMIEALAQAEFTLVGQPLTLHAQYIQNQEADDLDTGYTLGFNFGKAGNPNTWEFGYAWAVTEKDAQFGQFIDSDFGGGVTDVDGSVFRFGYAPMKNWVINGTYFLNKRFVDAPGAIESDYDRYQIDLNYKF
jgi:regulator of replication initiation timing